MPANDVIYMGFLASLCASFGTTVGSLGVFTIRQLSRKMEDGLLSLAAGIMLAASFFLYCCLHWNTPVKIMALT